MGQRKTHTRCRSLYPVSDNHAPVQKLAETGDCIADRKNTRARIYFRFAVKVSLIRKRFNYSGLQVESNERTKKTNAYVESWFCGLLIATNSIPIWTKKLTPISNIANVVLNWRHSFILLPCLYYLQTDLPTYKMEKPIVGRQNHVTFMLLLYFCFDWFIPCHPRRIDVRLAHLPNLPCSKSSVWGLSPEPVLQLSPKHCWRTLVLRYRLPREEHSRSMIEITPELWIVYLTDILPPPQSLRKTNRKRHLSPRPILVLRVQLVHACHRW